MDLVEHGRNGYLIDVGDVGELEKALTMLGNGLDTIDRFGVESRKLIEAKFSLDMVAERYSQLYEELGGKKGRAGDGSGGDHRCWGRVVE